MDNNKNKEENNGNKPSINCGSIKEKEQQQIKELQINNMNHKI